jgi:hypothetical protein
VHTSVQVFERLQEENVSVTDKAEGFKNGSRSSVYATNVLKIVRMQVLSKMWFSFLLTLASALACKANKT